MLSVELYHHRPHHRPHLTPTCTNHHCGLLQSTAPTPAVDLATPPMPAHRPLHLALPKHSFQRSPNFQPPKKCCLLMSSTTSPGPTPPIQMLSPPVLYTLHHSSNPNSPNSPNNPNSLNSFHGFSHLPTLALPKTMSPRPTRLLSVMMLLI